MSRRSPRLTLRGYYSPSDGSDSTDSTSPTRSPAKISYRESPVRIFKRKSRTRRVADVMGVTSDLHSLSQKVSVAMSPPSSIVAPLTPSTFNLLRELKLSSGYSSEEGYHNRTRPNSSSRGALLVLYWWLGPAWYSLTAGLSWVNVSLLSSCSVGVRKAILLLFLLFLLLVLGLLHCYPSVTAPVLVTDTQAFVQPHLDDRTAFATLLDLKAEMHADLYRHQARWTQGMEDVLMEIRLLKQEGQKQKFTHEMLKADLAELRVRARAVHSQHGDVDKDLRGIQHQISDLRSDVSDLRSSSKHLSGRLDAQNTPSARLKTELSDWLRRHLPGSASSGKGVVMQPELQMELETLEKRILERLDTHREKDEGAGVLTVQDVEQIVHKALSVFRADGIGMPDYALESSGACVIYSRCSESYSVQTACFSLFGIPLYYYTNSPRTVIQPELYPGRCWAFRGSEGFLTISLSDLVKITHVTLEHLPRVLSPTGHIQSAPKDFAVYGMTNESEEGKLLGRFSYNQEGEPIQIFKIQDPPNQEHRLVELRILSNWGNPEYTCVYRFRVHGQPWTT
ncbi:SUN domain-containing protein 2-like [Salminus brasiliensis]|uniref:SUN domain-containing protein 2-like n=1 Tax=Salminus brasiliensis TaxID=930266 RepID=UPI003B82FE47